MKYPPWVLAVEAEILCEPRFTRWFAAHEKAGGHVLLGKHGDVPSPKALIVFG